jgi:hypothetical protein
MTFSSILFAHFNFSYPNGYVVTLADMDLTVISYVITGKYIPLFSITRMPDIMITEMLADRRLVFLDNLVVGGVVSRPSRTYENMPMTSFQRPYTILRKSWNCERGMPPGLREGEAE